MKVMPESGLGAFRAAAMITMALFTGCGDDPPQEEGDNTPDGSRDAGGKGEKDAGKDSQDAGSEAKDAGKEVRCGDAVCAASAIAPACCTGPGAGKAGDPTELTGRGPDLCGADLTALVGAYACIQINQPGKLDPACPATPSPGGELPGCCTSEGFCAGMEPNIPLGCVYPATGRGAACAK